MRQDAGWWGVGFAQSQGAKQWEGAEAGEGQGVAGPRVRVEAAGRVRGGGGWAVPNVRWGAVNRKEGVGRKGETDLHSPTRSVGAHTSCLLPCCAAPATHVHTINADDPILFQVGDGGVGPGGHHRSHYPTIPHPVYRSHFHTFLHLNSHSACRPEMAHFCRPEMEACGLGHVPVQTVMPFM